MLLDAGNTLVAVQVRDDDDDQYFSQNVLTDWGDMPQKEQKTAAECEVWHVCCPNDIPFLKHVDGYTGMVYSVSL